MKKVDLILLAAGRSSRFGSNKLLYSLQGKPLFRHTAAALSPLPFHRRIVVTRTPEIAVSLQAEGYTAVLLPCSAENPGLSLSIQAGLMQAKEAEGYLFTVCDRPYMQTASYRLLLETFDTSGKGIACFTMPQEPDKPVGNPAVFAASYKEELLQLEGDKGGKSIICRHWQDVASLIPSSPDEWRDIDTPEDMAHFVSPFSHE